jgi:lysophospholipase L1-like esterase
MTLQAAPTRRPSAERIATFVAMGDSFTAGTGALPGEAWPERLAAGLGPRVQLHNLAVHGAMSADVLVQLPEALDLEPELVTVVCGAG